MSLINFKTPQKSQSLSPSQINFRKHSSNVVNSSSTIKSVMKTPTQGEKSLIQKIIQNQLMHEEQYQNLLIEAKQIQLSILNQEQAARDLKKKYKKTDKNIIEVKEKLAKANQAFIKKQQYLDRFYVHLDSKLKNNVNSQLFSKLQKIQAVLNNKYLHQKQDLQRTLDKQKEKASQANEQLNRLKQYHQQLVKEYTERAIEQTPKQGAQSSSHNDPSTNSYKRNHKNSIYSQNENLFNSKIQKKQQRKRAKEEAKDEIQFFKDNIKKLKKQKDILENDEKLLKLLLNIDQQHRKYSAYIISGFKKQFTIKYRKALCHKRNSPIQLPTPKKELQEMRIELSQKMTEKNILKQEIEERNQLLENSKLKLNEEIGQYSELQHKIMRASNHPNRQSTVNRQSYNESRGSY